MADGKKIEIKFSAAGAEQAAKQVDKVADATKATAKAGGELDQSNVRIVDSTKRTSQGIRENVDALKQWQEERRRAATAGGSSSLAFDPAASRAEEKAAAAERLAAARAANMAAEQEAAANRALAQAKEEARQASENLAASKRKLTLASRNASKGARGLAAVMGGPLSRVSSVLYAGPIGLLTAGVGLLAAQFVRLRREAQEKTVAALEAVGNAAERAAEKIDESMRRRNAEDLREFNEGLIDISKSLEAENRAITNNLTLLDEQGKARQKLAELNRQIRIEEINQSDMPEEEKIRRLAGIDAERAQEAAQAQLSELTRRNDAAARAAQDAARVVAAERANLESEEGLAAQQQGNLSVSRQAAQQKRLQAASIPELQERLQREQGALLAARLGPTSENATREDFRAAADAAKELESVVLETENQIAQAEAAARNLQQYENAEKRWTKAYEDAQAAVEARREAIEEAEAKAAAAAENESAVAEQTGAAADGVILALGAQDRLRGMQTNRQIGQVEARRAAEEQRQRENEERDRQKAVAAAQSKATQLGRESMSFLPEAFPRRFKDAMENVVAGLEDGDQGGELEMLLKAVESLNINIRGRSQADQTRIDRLEEQIRQTNAILKNNRPKR